MLTHILKTGRSLSNAISAGDLNAFRKAFAVAADRGWLQDVEKSVLQHVADEYANHAILKRPTADFLTMLRVLEIRVSAKNYSEINEFRTPLSVLAAINDAALINYMQHLLGQMQENNDIRNLDINGRYDSDIPLICAASSGNLDMIYTLIHFGANPDQQTLKHADTALHVVCRQPNPILSVIRALVGQGADPEINNVYGKKPIDLVRGLQQRKAVLNAIEQGYSLRETVKSPSLQNRLSN